jgi:hypothetical protein
MNTDDQAAGNALPPGVSLEQVEQAVQHSGYPLQAITSQLLKEQFRILPEWGYRDRITGDLRTLDILAIDNLFPLDAKDLQVHPFLALLIECKQASLPYIFFTEDVTIYTARARIPRISGFKSRKMSISTDDSSYSYSISMPEALGVYSTSFLQDSPRCSVFSKCVRKGDRLELSGTEAYSSIVMPMMSAMEHFEKTSISRQASVSHRIFIVLAIAVVDAPMIAYDVNRETDKLKFVPWHRVIRNEPDQEQPGSWASGISHTGFQSAIDIVHKDYLGTYLTKYVRPFAAGIADLLLQNSEAFSKSHIFVRGYGEDRTSDIWSRVGRQSPQLP